MPELIDYAKSRYPGEIAPLPSIEFTGPTRGGERLNIVLPHTLKEFAFGGVVSALEVAKHLTGYYANIRFLSLNPVPPGQETFDFEQYVINPEGKTIEAAAAASGDRLPCHDKEIFFCTYWTSALIWEAYASILGVRNLPVPDFYYFIQDFEPGFYPFGYKHALCLNTYSHKDHAHAVFNSEELAGYFARLGLGFKKQYVLKPSLNPVIHRRLTEAGFNVPAKDNSQMRILIYGRPHQPRNCFSAILAGLYLYMCSVPEQARGDYYILSAGQEHEDIVLAPGVVVKSLGKLPVEKYVDYLEFCNIGVSMMVSPHPSYPPLEMALYGLYTITNAFGGKDLSVHHPGIRSLPVPSPDALALELAKAARHVKTTPPKEQKAVIPANMSRAGWEENTSGLGMERIGAGRG